MQTLITYFVIILFLSIPAYADTEKDKENCKRIEVEVTYPDGSVKTIEMDRCLFKHMKQQTAIV